MSRPRRAVFDTSTLVSAALRAGSAPYLALQLALGACEICASEDTLNELARVLRRGKFDRYLEAKLRRNYVALIRSHASIYAVEKTHVAAVYPPCRDPGDNLFLALALAAEADVVVSSDEDLLVLHPWKNVPILLPSGFLAWMEDRPRGEGST
jgi:putative PIN family toxin of toxin-antitoxin system